MTKARAKSLKFKQDQEHILRRIGAALIVHWDELPDKLQDSVIDQAAVIAELDDAVLEPEAVENFIRTAKVRDFTPSDPV